MNKDNIRTWIHALESGDYAQGTGHLHEINDIDGTSDSEDFFCCLGVGCVVAGIPESGSHGGAVAYGHEEQTGLAPREFMEWLDLPSAYVAGVGGDLVIQGDMADPVTLTSLNDQGASFLEIAMLLRQEFDIPL